MGVRGDLLRREPSLRGKRWRMRRARLFQAGSRIGRTWPFRRAFQGRRRASVPALPESLAAFRSRTAWLRRSLIPGPRRVCAKDGGGGAHSAPNLLLLALNVGSLCCHNLSGARRRPDLYEPSRTLIVGAWGFFVGIERRNNSGSPQLRDGDVRQATKPRSGGAAGARVLRASPSLRP